MIEFGLGIAATLASEFLLAHVYLWWENRQTAKLDASSLVAAKASTFGTVWTDVKRAEGAVKAGVERTETFFEDLFKHAESVTNSISTNTVANTSNISTGTTSTPTPILSVGSASGAASVG